MKLLKNRHSVYKLSYHIVLVTKQKCKCINDELFLVMKDEAYRLIENWGGSVVQIAHGEDYVRLLVDLPPQIAPSKAVGSLKTLLARKVRRVFEDYLKSIHHEDSFWNDSYLVLSSGGAADDVISRYIEDQAEKP